MIEIKRPVFFNGENPGMTLFVPGTEQATAVISYWHCTDSPWGVGDVLILWLATDVQPGGIFTNNLDLAQRLTNNLTQYFPEFRAVPIHSLPYLAAHCGHSFDGVCYRVVAQTQDLHIAVEWHDILDRKQIIWTAFPAGTAVYDLTTVICPCQFGRVWLNDELLEAEVQVTQAEDGRFLSTAFLAFAETWIGPQIGSGAVPTS